MTCQPLDGDIDVVLILARDAVNGDFAFLKALHSDKMLVVGF